MSMWQRWGPSRKPAWTFPGEGEKKATATPPLDRHNEAQRGDPVLSTAVNQEEHFLHLYKQLPSCPQRYGSSSTL